MPINIYGCMPKFCWFGHPNAFYAFCLNRKELSDGVQIPLVPITKKLSKMY